MRGKSQYLIKNAHMHATNMSPSICIWLH